MTSHSLSDCVRVLLMQDTKLARQRLDERLGKWPVAPPRPAKGWIRAIREALGMTSSDLGRRLGLSRQGVSQIEASEANDTIQLGTLRRAAEALDCTLSYALIPNRPLEQIVERRARHVALGDVAAVKHTMLLENQLEGTSGDKLLEELTEQLRGSRRLWRE